LWTALRHIDEDEEGLDFGGRDSREDFDSMFEKVKQAVGT
jgi:hypothetical protein